MRGSKQISPLAAHKGKAVVVMDTHEYKDKITVMLADERVSKKLKSDPTRVYKKQLVAPLTG